MRTATKKPEDNLAMLPEMASESETHKNLVSHEATFPRHVRKQMKYNRVLSQEFNLQWFHTNVTHLRKAEVFNTHLLQLLQGN